jgi:hypothetical protein
MAAPDFWNTNQHNRFANFSAEKQGAVVAFVFSWYSACSFLTTIVVATALVALAACLWPSTNAVGGRERGSAGSEDLEPIAGCNMRPGGLLISEPDGPFRITDAHRNMQLHLNCHPNGCPRKARAIEILEATGRLVVDRSRYL